MRKAVFERSERFCSWENGEQVGIVTICQSHLDIWLIYMKNSIYYISAHQHIITFGICSVFLSTKSSSEVACTDRNMNSNNRNEQKKRRKEHSNWIQSYFCIIYAFISFSIWVSRCLLRLFFERASEKEKIAPESWNWIQWLPVFSYTFRSIH